MHACVCVRASVRVCVRVCVCVCVCKDVGDMSSEPRGTHSWVKYRCGLVLLDLYIDTCMSVCVCVCMCVCVCVCEISLHISPAVDILICLK